MYALLTQSDPSDCATRHWHADAPRAMDGIPLAWNWWNAQSLVEAGSGPWSLVPVRGLGPGPAPDSWSLVLGGPGPGPWESVVPGSGPWSMVDAPGPWSPFSKLSPCFKNVSLFEKMLPSLKCYLF